MKRKVVALLSMVVFMSVMLMTGVTAQDGSNGPLRGTTMIKDSIYYGTLTPGYVYEYTFTPTASGRYVVESFGSTDTYGIVEGAFGGTLENDDSGSGDNFAIGFAQAAGVATTIKVRHYSSSGSGNFSVQVRNQRAQIFTFNYGAGDIDTTPDSAVPRSNLLGMGFSVGTRENKPVSYINSIIAQTFTVWNSEIIMFSGHGNAGSLAFKADSGYDILLDNSSSFTSMANTRIAVWAACYSAVDPDGTSGPRVSIADKSIAMGARSAIGWTQMTNAIASRKWTDQFFTELSDGKTVSQAAASAGSVFLWPWEGSYAGWVVKGNGGTSLTTPAVNPKGSEATCCQEGFKISNEKEFMNFINNFDSMSYELKGLGTRYYKTIGGCLTNDFYDVYTDGTILKSAIDIKKDEIKAIEKDYEQIEPIYAASIDDSTSDRLIKTKTYNVFVKINNKIIPISISYSDYENEFGTMYQKVFCVNAQTGETIDYCDICSVIN